MKDRFRERLRSQTCALALGLLLALGCGQTAYPKPKNLLLITLDTLRADHLGAYGYPRPTSPHLDRFAASATVFLDVTCSMPTTLPSHLSILTGLTPAQHGVHRNGELPQRELPSFFAAIEEQGAKSAAIVAAGVLREDFLRPLGIDQFFDLQDQATYFVDAEVINQRAIAWLEKNGEQPFALWLHYFDTHEPYTPPPAFAERFTEGYAGPLPNALDTPWLVSLNRAEVRAGLSERDLRHVVDLYDAEIAYLDAQLGRLFSFLEERRLLAETLVVLVGDHGQAHGENDFFGHGEKLIEPVIKVPLIVRMPGQKRHFEVEAAVETLDIVPTLADLFGFAPGAEARGRSLRAALQGGELAPASLRVVERRSYPAVAERRGIVLHAGEQKWIYYRETAGATYHHGKAEGVGGLDGENFYVANSRAARRLEQLVTELDASTRESAPLPADVRDMLRSLGYL